MGEIFLSKRNNHLVDMVVIQTLVRAFQRHPLAANCSAYALFSASAELIQQHFEARHDGVKKVGAYQIFAARYLILKVHYPHHRNTISRPSGGSGFWAAAYWGRHFMLGIICWMHLFPEPQSL